MTKHKTKKRPSSSKDVTSKLSNEELSLEVQETLEKLKHPDEYGYVELSKKDMENLSTLNIPKSLKKRGMQKVEDNIADGHSLSCGHILFECFKEELCERFLTGGDKKKN